MPTTTEQRELGEQMLGMQVEQEKNKSNNKREETKIAIIYRKKY